MKIAQLLATFVGSKEYILLDKDGVSDINVSFFKGKRYHIAGFLIKLINLSSAIPANKYFIGGYRKNGLVVNLTQKKSLSLSKETYK